MIENFKEYYGKMGEVVNSLPKVGWKQIVIRFRKDERHNSIGIYFQKDRTFKLVSDLIEEEIMERYQYNNILSELDDIADEIQDELRKNGQKIWKSLIVSLWDDGKYEVEYSYDELDDDYRENAIWRYKRLGIIPDEQTMKYIQNMK
ncbi:MAG: DUF600 family protein [Lachnospiraceae bacterium]|nr:DUF600 family protein [Lachnospiraceae bacterium]